MAIYVKRRGGNRTRSKRLEVGAQSATRLEGARAPLLPHEHDESPERGPMDPAVVQAHDDLSRGLIDTDRRQDAPRVFERARPSRPPRRR